MAFGMKGKEYGSNERPQQQNGFSENEASYLDEFAGQGLEGITAEAVSTPWLSIMQDSTRHVKEKSCESGVWRNSATGDVYGKTIEVVPVDFKIIWNERDDTGATVANHEPNSIHLKVTPNQSGRGFPKMTNPETGNRVDETFLYAVVFPGKPDAGYMLLQAGMGSISSFKKLNALLRAQTLPNGKRAPIFAYSWYLTIGDTQARNKNGQDYYRVEDVKRGQLVSKELFISAVAPARELSAQSQLALPPADESYERVEE
jgi:hypothetical protein